MLPDLNQVGVILEPADMPLVTDAFNTARRFESPNPLKGSSTFELPPTREDGLIPIDELTAQDIETYAVIGLNVLTREIKAANYEYDSRITSGIPANMAKAAEIEKKLQSLESHAITLQGLKRTIEENLQLSVRSGFRRRVES